MSLKTIVTASLILMGNLFSETNIKEYKGLYDVCFGIEDTNEQANERLNYVKLNLNPKLINYFDIVQDEEKYLVILDVNSLYPFAYEISKTFPGMGVSQTIQDANYRRRTTMQNERTLFKVEVDLTYLIKNYCEYNSPAEFKKIKNTISEINGRIYPDSYIEVPKNFIKPYFLEKEEIKKETTTETIEDKVEEESLIETDNKRPVRRIR
ncbi:MAG: hypothetical protein AB7V77_04610 [Candidatus Woesearchaeota archaeon]